MKNILIVCEPMLKITKMTDEKFDLLDFIAIIWETCSQNHKYNFYYSIDMISGHLRMKINKISTSISSIYSICSRHHMLQSLSFPNCLSEWVRKYQSQIYHIYKENVFQKENIGFTIFCYKNGVRSHSIRPVF